MKVYDHSISFYICTGERSNKSGLQTSRVTREFEQIVPGYSTIESFGGYRRDPAEYSNIVTHFIESDDQDDIDNVRECLYRLQAIQAEYEQTAMFVVLDGRAFELENLEDYIECFNRYVQACHPVLLHDIRDGLAVWPGY